MKIAELTNVDFSLTHFLLPLMRSLRDRGHEVVGICADIVQEVQDRDAPPLVFITYRQEAWGWMGLVLRTSSDPGALAAPVRAAVQKIDQDLPLFDVRTLTTALERQRWFLVVFGTLFLSFALTGLLMASVGIYAVVAQATVRRTREIGIRMALGATATNIVRMVLARGLFQLLKTARIASRSCSSGSVGKSLP